MNSKKKQILKNLKNTYCRLQPSKISGVGVFAIREIPKGINPFSDVRNSKYHRFSLKELKGLDKEVLRMIDDFFVIEKDGFVNITESALNNMDISFFPNHSNKPNLQVFEEKRNDSLCFKTIRKIKRGEELTFSYQEYED